MNSSTSFSEIALLISSRRGLAVWSVMRASLRVGLDRKCVDAAAQLVAEYVVYEPVLGDPAEALECGRGHDRIEVVPVAVHLGPGTGNSGLDPVFQLLWSRRHTPSLASRTRRYTC